LEWKKWGSFVLGIGSIVGTVLPPNHDIFWFGKMLYACMVVVVVWMDEKCDLSIDDYNYFLAQHGLALVLQLEVQEV